MKKGIFDLIITNKEDLGEGYYKLCLTSEQGKLPAMQPGQFVEVLVENAASTFLRRPISINYVDNQKNELWLLIHQVGEGTKQLFKLNNGDTLNCVLPLGNSFLSKVSHAVKSPLLIGGGVGLAPMLFLGKHLKEQGITPTFLLGGRSQGHILQKELFEHLGNTFYTTEDGTLGERGYVTMHSILQQSDFDYIATCGPKAMMQAVVSYAKEKDIACEVSLENLMACGIGACLCCVEKTVRGNLCVCTEGPIFNSKELIW